MKTLKWIYDLGKLHERRRIELAIITWRRSEKLHTFLDEKEQVRQRAVDHEVQRVLDQILWPRTTEVVEKNLLDD